MNKTIRELMNQRAAKIQAMKQLNDLADTEKRQFTEDEQRFYDETMAEVENLAGEIERRSNLENLVSEAAETINNPHRENPAVGMSSAEIRNYRLVRAIDAATRAARGERGAWDSAKLEFEASRATAERLGFEPQGFFVPFDVMSGGEQRDLNVGTATAGGNLVATDLLSASFIELLRNKLILQAAGATMLTGLVGDIAVPKQTAGATAYWVAEGNAPTESQQTVGQVALTPHTVGAFTEYTRKLLKQSSIDVEMFVRNDLAAVLALAIDYAGLHGSSSVDANQPDGVAVTSGIGSVVAGDPDGAAPDWGDIVKFETEVSQDNADIGRLAYIINGKVRGKLKTTAKVSSTDSVMIWDFNNPGQPLNGYPVHVTNQVRSNITKGGGSSLSASFFGNWADLVLAMWGGLDILVDPYSLGTSGGVRIVALQDVDFGVRHAESFAYCGDFVTT